MIKHIVFMTFKPEFRDDIPQVQQRLMALPALIPEIQYLEVEANVVPSERNCDLVLYSHFESLEALRAYQQHPDHVDVLAIIRARVSSIVVGDYEV